MRCWSFVPTRGTPLAQFNSFCALGALGVVASKVTQHLSQDDVQLAEQAVEYVGYTRWLTMLIDTLMTALDSAYRPRGTLLSVLQQVHWSPLTGRSLERTQILGSKCCACM